MRLRWDGIIARLSYRFNFLAISPIAIARGDIACPVNALRAWLDAADIEAGPFFRPINKAGTVAASRLTCRSVANVVKAYAGRAGFDASTFSGHSLRSRLSHLCRRQGRVNLQDDGCVPP